jgi:hypothetical protein
MTDFDMDIYQCQPDVIKSKATYNKWAGILTGLMIENIGPEEKSIPYI